jgi:signal peptidase II
MRTRTHRLLLFVAVVTMIGCDRVTKHAAITRLADEPRWSFLADTVRLDYAENRGGFLSLGAEWPASIRTAVLTVGTGLMLLIVIAAAVRFRVSRWPMTGIALIVAGGGSNWLDRVTRGSVPDFINVGIGPVRTGIFNVADVAITLGAAILLLAELRRSRNPPTMA